MVTSYLDSFLWKADRIQSAVTYAAYGVDLEGMNLEKLNNWTETRAVEVKDTDLRKCS